MNNETGEGSLELLTPDITTNDDEIEIQTHDVDEDKITFITIANETVYENTIENDTVYTFNISDIDEAQRTDYDPKVQLIQTSDDDISGEGDIITFKQERYTVEEE